MLQVHPLIQFTATALSLYVLFLGWRRFQSLHLGRQAAFARARHVSLGLIVILAWLAGLIGGLYMVRAHWHGNLITGPHGYVGLVMLPLLLSGLISGLILDRIKKKRRALPFLHGLNNLILVILALGQIASGYGVYQTLVLGH